MAIHRSWEIPPGYCKYCLSADGEPHALGCKKEMSKEVDTKQKNIAMFRAERDMAVINPNHSDFRQWELEMLTEKNTLFILSLFP